MSAPTTIRVVIADDHPLVIDGIRARLETYAHIDILGEARDGETAVALAEKLDPDVMLMDISMPGLSGLDAVERLQERVPQVRVLVLSMHDNKEYILSALRAGAAGYILKDVSSQEMIGAIETVHGGGTYLCGGVSEVLGGEDASEVTELPLTTREQTILALLAEGASNKHVARKLDISVRTVETHRRNIKKKLRVDTSAGLTRWAIENGLIALDAVRR